MSEDEAHNRIFDQIGKLEKDVAIIKGGIGVCAFFATLFGVFVLSYVMQIGDIKATVDHIAKDIAKGDTDVRELQSKVDELQEKCIKLELLAVNK